ncbi:cytochrome P450 [Suillus ampliporus]|nr:cytochrome P450 [Suillus ampliporus]
MSFLQPFLAFLSSTVPRLQNLSISENILRAAACLGIVGLIARTYLAKSESGLPLPPSPPTWRLRGHSLPPSGSYLTEARWIDEYGPLITLRSGLENFVAAVDIMENQGKSVADRPRSIAAGELLNGGLNIASEPFGERFRRMRRALHTHLQPKAAEAYQPLQMSHAKNTVLSILDDPYNFQNHVETYTATTTMKVAYGTNTPTCATDPDVIEINELVRMTGMVRRPGAYLVDTIPWLKYLPWYGRDLRRGFERSKKLNAGHLNRVKEQMQQSNVDIGPSFAKHVLESDHIYGFSESEKAFLVGGFFGAGTHISQTAAICTTFMAAACFPEEQAKVQAELDAVVGRHRAPTFTDHNSLPCLQAFISETLRWRPPVPVGGIGSSNYQRSDLGELLHSSWDYGFRERLVRIVLQVTKDLMVIALGPSLEIRKSTLSLTAFKPQRWLDGQGRLRDDLSFFVYGFGRRVCPGQHVANRSIFINTLLILWAFRLTLDPTKPLDDMGFMNGEIEKPPCAIEFEARIPEAELRNMMQNYPENLEAWMQ